MLTMRCLSRKSSHFIPKNIYILNAISTIITSIREYKKLMTFDVLEKLQKTANIFDY